MKPSADINAMREWAATIMARQPDVVIGDDYLRRWWVIPRNGGCNVYLHEILHSDDDSAMHDHPWDNTSMLLDGSYIEHTPAGSVTHFAGSVVSRKAGDAHWLEIPTGGRAVSLFMTGPVVRDWGFHCADGWQLWTDYSAAKKAS